MAPKISWKTELLPVLCLLATFALAFYFYANFPERVPTHWNIRGEIDGWSPRGFAAFFFPAFNAFLYVMFLVFPRIEPP